MYLVKGLPNLSFATMVNGDSKLNVLPNVYNVSYSQIFNGDTTDFEFILIENESFLIVKGITIYGDGNTGIVEIKSLSNDILERVYFSNDSKNFVFGDTNYRLPEAEGIKISLIGRGIAETFIGITYINVFTGQEVNVYELFLDVDGEMIETFDNEEFYVFK